MWQIFLIPLSIALLVSTLIPSLRGATSARGVLSKPEEELKTVYPTPIFPTQRK